MIFLSFVIKLKVPRQNLIFVITNGRSGSSRLAKLFACLKNVDAFHEPSPSFGPYMHDVAGNIELGKIFFRYLKFPAIAKFNKPFYVETTHMFCKGYFEALFQFNIPFSIIILKRDRRSIAKSMYALNTIPGRSQDGIRYYLQPNEAKFIQLGDWSQLTDYQLCYWHVCEIEIRQKFYSRLMKERQMMVAEVDTDALNTEGVFENLLANLNIEVSSDELKKISAIRTSRENEKKNKKNNLSTSLDKIDFEDEERPLLILKDKIERVYNLEG